MAERDGMIGLNAFSAL
ncbi:hypothetical protein QUF78_00635 [Peribacillus sp. ACCC06369]|nr:hypothetical protein [Peribacillus sp. ACCC06369]MDM5356487.1 hypothetical protein [Peribacillus sp. ACCC06369]